MNTVDPNEKVAKVSAPPSNEEAPVAPQAAEKSNDAPLASHNGDEAAKAAQNLPQYHHHRSTALW
jgi:hypothetical protein